MPRKCESEVKSIAWFVVVSIPFPFSSLLPMHTFDLFTNIFKWQEKVQGKRLQVLLQLSFSNSVLCFEDKHCFLAAIPNRRNCVKWEDLSLLHVTRRDTGCLSVT